MKTKSIKKIMGMVLVMVVCLLVSTSTWAMMGKKSSWPLVKKMQQPAPSSILNAVQSRMAQDKPLELLGSLYVLLNVYSELKEEQERSASSGIDNKSIKLVQTNIEAIGDYLTRSSSRMELPEEKIYFGTRLEDSIDRAGIEGLGAILTNNSMEKINKKSLSTVSRDEQSEIRRFIKPIAREICEELFKIFENNRWYDSAGTVNYVANRRFEITIAPKLFSWLGNRARALRAKVNEDNGEED